ncbi:hypothetical protein JGY85_04265 [Shigella sonnei]|nr:hypothetical protein [Shigella sonnei]
MGLTCCSRQQLLAGISSSSTALAVKPQRRLEVPGAWNRQRRSAPAVAATLPEP